jgi:hypothetical protein
MRPWQDCADDGVNFFHLIWLDFFSYPASGQSFFHAGTKQPGHPWGRSHWLSNISFFSAISQEVVEYSTSLINCDAAKHEFDSELNFSQKSDLENDSCHQDFSVRALPADQFDYINSLFSVSKLFENQGCWYQVGLSKVSDISIHRKPAEPELTRSSFHLEDSCRPHAQRLLFHSESNITFFTRLKTAPQV